MICYKLVCGRDHAFEGWYKDSATFVKLQAQALLSCPECGISDVRQALMAPAIAKNRPGNAGFKKILASEGAAIQTRQESALPDTVMVALQKIRQVVEQNCENVGDNFATEVVRIHHGEAPERGIYGSTTPSERAMLREEGVDVVSIPWVKRPES